MLATAWPLFLSLLNSSAERRWALRSRRRRRDASPNISFLGSRRTSLSSATTRCEELANFLTWQLKGHLMAAATLRSRFVRRKIHLMQKVWLHGNVRGSTNVSPQTGQSRSLGDVIVTAGGSVSNVSALSLWTPSATNGKLSPSVVIHSGGTMGSDIAGRCCHVRYEIASHKIFFINFDFGDALYLELFVNP